MVSEGFQPIYVIVAVDEKNGMGKDGRLPWHLTGELKFFRKITIAVSDVRKKNMVIMGRKTWESIPQDKRPLSGRINIVITRNRNYEALGATVCHSIEEALHLADSKIAKIFVIGGAELISEVFSKIPLEGIYISRIKKDYYCDVFLPEIPQCYSKIKKLGSAEEKGIRFDYLLYLKD